MEERKVHTFSELCIPYKEGVATTLEAFEIFIDIDTDGDFGYTCEFPVREFMFTNFESAVGVLLARLKGVRDTLYSSRDYVLEKVERELNYIINHLDTFDFNEYPNTYCYEMDCGNQTGIFTVKKVDLVLFGNSLVVKEYDVED